MKKIAILGSTGSIGTQTLDVVRANGDIEVLGISAGRNIAKLEEQITRVSSRSLWLSGMKRQPEDLAQKIAGSTDTKVVAGMDGLFGAGSNAGDGDPCYRDRGNDRDPSYDRGHPCRKGHCAGKQGDSGNCRTSDHAAGRGIWCEDPAGGQ